MHHPSQPPPHISVVIPVFNEAGNVAALAGEVAEALNAVPHEIIFVNDASTDETLATLQELKVRQSHVRILTHRKNSGQSRALRTAILAAKSPVIATLDGDGQNDPADILNLYHCLTGDDRAESPAPGHLVMVGGHRVKRQDSLAKKLASRFGNRVRRAVLKDEADDTGCGIKLFRREAFLRLPYFDHMHRYLPALMLREGFTCEYVEVNHRPRLSGHSKYNNFGRLIVSLFDLLGVLWLRRRAKNPQGWDET